MIKPAITHLELVEETVLIGVTDGVTHAGRYGGGPAFSFEWVYDRLNSGRPVQELADEILGYAISLDGGKPRDDMVVAVLTVTERPNALGIRRMSVSYPF